MKRLCLALSCIAQALTVMGEAAGQAADAVQNQFKCQLYTAQSGALYAAAKGNTHVNDLVDAVLVDSKDWVFAGTANGLAVYDGRRWTNRTFRIKGLSFSERLVLGLRSISECGPAKIAEGPPGTIWLGGILANSPLLAIVNTCSRSSSLRARKRRAGAARTATNWRA